MGCVSMAKRLCKTNLLLNTLLSPERHSGTARLITQHTQLEPDFK